MTYAAWDNILMDDLSRWSILLHFEIVKGFRILPELLEFRLMLCDSLFQ